MNLIKTTCTLIALCSLGLSGLHAQDRLSGRSITTPGCVDGWVALHEKFGVLDLARLMEPTVSYAKAGIPVTSEVADFFRTFEESVQKSDNPSFKKVFFTDGRFPRKGEILKNPDFGDIPLEELLSKKYAAERRALIDPAKAGEYHPGLSAGDHTVYLTIADKDGNMVSLIQSLSSGLGSRVVPEGLGFILQNRGSGFVLEEGHINQYGPGKRPFHTIIPAFITKEGKPFVSFGLMGGDMQVPGHVQVVMNLIDFGMNLQEAGDAPRVFHSGTSARGGRVPGLGETFLESGFPYETISELMDKGHVIRMDKGIYGGYQAIMLKDGVYYGASESRKDGQAVGY
ncbi:gamma-glutamyltransferase family protein [Lunatimonas salinarum]|uniref:gamma-glutamyltransferase family protein n=1 Tax=Lunatimonas salinarum TaxID=1774590 RepID=UPI001FD78EE0|nr:gamma-glutamyltransferase [Lunatimonas salinarum]